MTLLVWILLGEVALLAMFVSVGLMIANRRRYNRILQTVSELLDQVVNTEAQRLAWL
jgi:hypothetical protein